MRALTTLDDWYELREKALEALDEFVDRELNPRFAGGRYIVKPFDVMFSPELEEVTIDFGYVTRYYEISEAVASGVEQRCAEDNLSPEECEKLYEQAYRDELEELNNECVIRVNKKMEFPELGASVEAFPDECDGDYCFCGAGITLKIKLHDAKTVEDAVKKIVETTRHVLNRVMPEIINA
jgi:hypothetical protein